MNSVRSNNLSLKGLQHQVAKIFELESLSLRQRHNSFEWQPGRLMAGLNRKNVLFLYWLEINNYILEKSTNAFSRPNVWTDWAEIFVDNQGWCYRVKIRAFFSKVLKKNSKIFFFNIFFLIFFQGQRRALHLVKK